VRINLLVADPDAVAFAAWDFLAGARFASSRQSRA
jgi:hypothetical protein